MMEVSIILKGIAFGGVRSVPEARTALVAFELHADKVGTIEFNVSVVPQDDDPDGLDGAVMIAKRTLIEFGEGLAAAGENYKPPMIYSPSRK
jgi:hypothetical protein